MLGTQKILLNKTTWALSRENLSSRVCEQHMHRTAYAYVKSDQPLCYSLIGNYHIKTCCKGNFIILASLCCLVGWFECHFVVNPEDRFSRVTSHIGFGKLYGYKSIKQSYLEACKFSHDYEETKTLQIWTST